MRFDDVSTGELADIWYAVAGAEIRHPGCFTGLLDGSYAELLRRLGGTLDTFVDRRFAKLRALDAADDAFANERAASEPSCDGPAAEARK